MCYICTECHADLPILTHSCARCAQILPITLNNSQDPHSPFLNKEHTCGRCLKQPPPFVRTYAPYFYAFPINRLIVSLKFKKRLDHAHALGHLLACYIQAHRDPSEPLPDLLLPMPLHVSRLRERGFNQAVEIAKPIAHLLHIPLDKYGVKRVKKTAAQSGLSAKERKQNMQQAFTNLRDYSGLSIALVDDVMTTGESMRVLSELLQDKGCKRIEVWCCARQT